MRSARRCVLVSALLLSVVMGGCAVTAINNCAEADWYMVGFEDGTAGRPTGYFDTHNAHCAGTTDPDQLAWQAGHEDGLTHYCSAAGGIAEGSRGLPRSGVCPTALAADFIEGHRLGREIYLTSERMQAIEQEIRALEARRSADLLSPALGDDTRGRIRQLEMEYDRLRRELRILELRAERLSRK